MIIIIIKGRKCDDGDGDENSDSYDTKDITMVIIITK